MSIKNNDDYRKAIHKAFASQEFSVFILSAEGLFKLSDFSRDIEKSRVFRHHDGRNIKGLDDLLAFAKSNDCDAEAVWIEIDEDKVREAFGHPIMRKKISTKFSWKLGRHP